MCFKKKLKVGDDFEGVVIGAEAIDSDSDEETGSDDDSVVGEEEGL